MKQHNDFLSFLVLSKLCVRLCMALCGSFGWQINSHVYYICLPLHNLKAQRDKIMSCPNSVTLSWRLKKWRLISCKNKIIFKG